MGETVIISGNYRGGTTAVTALLQAAGVFMGPPRRMIYNQEDPDFAQHLHPIDSTPFLPPLKRLIEQRNGTFQSWGFKYPGTWAHINSIIHLFREPRAIFVFRCPYAVGLSELKHEELDPLEYTRTAAERSLRMVEEGEKLKERGFKVLFVSYEKLVLNKHEEVERILSFTGLDLPRWDQRFIDAVDAVNVKRGYGVTLK